MLKWSFYASAIAMLPLIQLLAEMGESQSRAEGICFIFYPLIMLGTYIQVHAFFKH